MQRDKKILLSMRSNRDFSVGSDSKEFACNAETWVQCLCWENPLEKLSGNPLQDSCLENPMNRGALWATTYGVAKSQTGLNQ